MFGGFFEQGEAELEVVVVEEGVEREVAADAGGVAAAHDLLEVFEVEGAAGAGSHVELGEAEVDGVGSGVDGGLQGGVATGGSEDFDVFGGGHGGWMYGDE